MPGNGHTKETYERDGTEMSVMRTRCERFRPGKVESRKPKDTQLRKKNDPKMESFFCGANGNLACIILVIASNPFDGSYSDELRSPQGLKILGDPEERWLDTGTHKKKRPEMSLFFVVPTGIEPVTQGFSVLCSTN